MLRNACGSQGFWHIIKEELSIVALFHVVDDVEELCLFEVGAMSVGTVTIRRHKGCRPVV